MKRIPSPLNPLKIRRILLPVFLIAAAGILTAGGSAESSASSTGRGKYLSGQGIIIPPEEVHINSYIASLDYQYPDPEDSLGISLYSGHRQISAFGQEEIIQIGIQGRRSDFQDLEPLNLAFVIDQSGSMNEQNKMDWVKEAFDIFIRQVRDEDFVSLVVFNQEATLLFPSLRMDTPERREQFRQTVQSIEPGGGTNLKAGLELGLQQVLANFRNDYTNRVLFLTDGMGESEGILEMAESYAAIGINISTIGVGTGFDLDLMTRLAEKGGGSSRFIADRKEMEQIFGSELSRMVTPVARDLKMVLELPPGVLVRQTWGYDSSIAGNTVHYYLPTLHLGDYETILVRIYIPRLMKPGPRELARFSVEYRDLKGQIRNTGPRILQAETVSGEFPVTGFSSGMVLQSGTILDFAERLTEIGRLYYSGQDQSMDTSSESQIKRCLDLAVETRKMLENARLRLDHTGFDDEIQVMEDYIRILGRDMELAETDVEAYRNDREIASPVPARSLDEHLKGLFREMTLNLGSEKPGVVAVAGFSMKSGGSIPLLPILDEMAVTEISRLDRITLVDRANLDEIIREQKLSLSALMDTTTAIEVGALLSANYIVTGTVIEMPNTFVIFGRIIDVETAEIESAAQVIMSRRVLDEL